MTARALEVLTNEGMVTARPADELLERAAELATLEHCYEHVRRSGEGRIVVVSGEAGIGKSALCALASATRASTAGACYGAPATRSGRRVR